MAHRAPLLLLLSLALAGCPGGEAAPVGACRDALGLERQDGCRGFGLCEDGLQLCTCEDERLVDCGPCLAEGEVDTESEGAEPAYCAARAPAAHPDAPPAPAEADFSGLGCGGDEERTVMGAPIAEGTCGWTMDSRGAADPCRCEGGSLYCETDACLVAGTEVEGVWESRDWRSDVLGWFGLPRDLDEWLREAEELHFSRDWDGLERHFWLLVRGGPLAGYPNASRFMAHFLDCSGAPPGLSFEDLAGRPGAVADRPYPDTDAIPFSEVRGPAYWRAVAARRRGTGRVDVGSWLTYPVSTDGRLALGRFWVRVYADYISDRSGPKVRLEYRVEDRYDFDPDRLDPESSAWTLHAAGQALVDHGRACEYDIAFRVTEEVPYTPGSSPCNDLLVCLDGLGGRACETACPPGGACERIRECGARGGGMGCFLRECFDTPRVCSGAQTCFRGGGGFSCFAPRRC